MNYSNLQLNVARLPTSSSQPGAKHISTAKRSMVKIEYIRNRLKTAEGIEMVRVKILNSHLFGKLKFIRAQTESVSLSATGAGLDPVKLPFSSIFDDDITKNAKMLSEVHYVTNYQWFSST